MPKINPKTLRVRNWDKWQSYRKDRGQPPWIKLHQSLRRDPDFITLTDAQKGQLMCLWLLAADKNGVIPYDPIKIQKLLYLSDKFDLEFFVSQGFLIKGNSRRQRDASVTTTCQPVDALETETETETYRQEPEKNAPLNGALVLPEWLPTESWHSWLAHLKEKRKTPTLSAQSAQIRKLEKYRSQGHTPDSVIEHSIAGNYQGLYTEHGNGLNGNSSGPKLSAIERVRRANAHILDEPEASGPIVDADGWTVRTSVD